MKIVLACSSFFATRGGVSAYNRELASLLIKGGHDVLVCSIDGHIKDVSLCHPDIKYYLYSIPSAVSLELSVVKELFFKVVEFSPDVIISSDNIHMTSLFSCFSDARVKITISHFYNGLLAKSSAVSPLHTDWIVALSCAGKQYLESLDGVCEEQVCVIYNSLEDVKSDIDVLFERKNINNRVDIVFPGGCNKAKSPKTIVRVANELARFNIDWRLTWLGNAGSFQNKLSNEAAKNVKFTGHIPRDKSIVEIEKANCFILPSIGEGCPISLLEAIRSGSVPIVSDCPSAMRELIINGVSGYVLGYKDYNGIVSAIRNISKDVNLRRNLMANARKMYLERLSPERWISSYEGLFKKRNKVINMNDCYCPQCVKRWHRRKVNKYLWPRVYLHQKLGFPDVRKIR